MGRSQRGSKKRNASGGHGVSPTNKQAKSGMNPDQGLQPPHEPIPPAAPFTFSPAPISPLPELPEPPPGVEISAENKYMMEVMQGAVAHSQGVLLNQTAQIRSDLVLYVSEQLEATRVSINKSFKETIEKVEEKLKKVDDIEKKVEDMEKGKGIFESDTTSKLKSLKSALESNKTKTKSAHDLIVEQRIDFNTMQDTVTSHTTRLGSLTGEIEKLKRTPQTQQQVETTQSPLPGGESELKTLVEGLQKKLMTLETEFNQKLQEKASKEEMNRREPGAPVNPLDDISRCIICHFVPYRRNEDAVETANMVLDELRQYLSIEVAVCDAKRLGKVDEVVMPLLKVALRSQEEKIAVLRAKMELARSSRFKKVFIRSSQTESERTTQRNMKVLMDYVPELKNEYRLSANSVLVKKSRANDRSRQDQRSRNQDTLGDQSTVTHTASRTDSSVQSQNANFQSRPSSYQHSDHEYPPLLGSQAYSQQQQQQQHSRMFAHTGTSMSPPNMPTQPQQYRPLSLHQHNVVPQANAMNLGASFVS